MVDVPLALEDYMARFFSIDPFGVEESVVDLEGPWNWKLKFDLFNFKDLNKRFKKKK